MSCEEPSSWVKNILKLADNSLYGMYQKSLGVFIYVVSCLTDFLDGYLARKFKLSSPFGAFLDPVADKVRSCDTCEILMKTLK